MFNSDFPYHVLLPFGLDMIAIDAERYEVVWETKD